MTAKLIVEVLLDPDSSDCLAALLGEASVQLPRRGSKWVAAFTDETGRQIWKSTGQRDRSAALILAENESRRLPGSVLPTVLCPQSRRSRSAQAVLSTGAGC